MDRYKKLAEVLRKHFGENMMPMFNAEVVSVEGESCTVLFDGLEINEVRLKATINGSDNKIILEPKPGSRVLIGTLTGDLKDLAVIKADEIAKLVYEQDGLQLTVDSTDGKVKLENESVSLYQLFQDLVDLLKQFKVYTPAGPSGTALPDTLTAIIAFETGFKQILK